MAGPGRGMGSLQSEGLCDLKDGINNKCVSTVFETAWFDLSVYYERVAVAASRLFSGCTSFEAEHP